LTSKDLHFGEAIGSVEGKQVSQNHIVCEWALEPGGRIHSPGLKNENIEPSPMGKGEGADIRNAPSARLVCV
jgi:hypothetical protein